MLINDRRNGQPLLPDSGPLQIVVPQDNSAGPLDSPGDHARGKATAMTELLTVRAAAERLGVAYSTLKQWIYDWFDPHHEDTGRSSPHFRIGSSAAITGNP